VTSKSNQVPYIVVYSPTLKQSTVGNRLREPLIRVRGQFPRCDWKNAVLCEPDEDRLFGGDEETTYLFRDDSAPRADPAVRVRIKDLLRDCPILAAEIKRRIKAIEAQAPERAAAARSLLERTFPLTSNVIGGAM
jgi:hypothetical protein